MTETAADVRLKDRGTTFPTKPLNAKAYGSIGHLPNSRLGLGDWHVHEGQARICTAKPRKGDRVIVTEKLDGACMAVANVDGEIVALTRSGYRASDGIYRHLRAFHLWVEYNRSKFNALRPGERICGEWLVMAHGTMFNPRHPYFAPFIAFDLIRGKDRVLRDEFRAFVEANGIAEAMVLSDGPVGYSVEQADINLGACGYHGAEKAEGAVWRVERENSVDFLAKYVRADKQDGRYFAQNTGEDVWIVDPVTFEPAPLSRPAAGGRAP